jgi:hypothetical protein
VVDEPPVRRGGVMMELVHDDVVRGVRLELAQISNLAQRLDRGEDDVGVRRLSSPV